MAVNTLTDVRVNFAVIGAFKAGTTALHRFLGQHPDVLLPSEKEPHFFDSDLAFPPWGPMVDLYHSYFPGFSGQTAVGDTTPTYMYSSVALDRMRAYNPELKLVVTLRDPVERAYSHFQMMRAMSKREGTQWWARERFSSFGLALAAEPLRTLHDRRTDFPSSYFVHSYLARGFYSPAIEGVLERFPRRQLLAIRSDHLASRHHETMTELLSFIGVDPERVPPPERSNVNAYPPLPEPYRWFLKHLYAAELERLERLFDWNLDDWRK